MVQEPGRVGESHIAMLWGSRGWQDLYKVPGYSPEVMGDADKRFDQFISNRHSVGSNS